jgi:hypothetical protein
MLRREPFNRRIEGRRRASLFHAVVLGSPMSARAHAVGFDQGRNEKLCVAQTRVDGAARSEFERAARSGTLRAPPATTPPKPAEATLGFSSTRKTIDNSPGWRYSSDQKKKVV